MRRSLLPLAVALAVAVLGACNSDDGADIRTAGNDAAVTTAAPSPTQGGDEEPASTEPVAVEHAIDETAHLADVRAGAHEGFERVTFEFDDALPGYRVEYAERPVTQDGSGDEVELEGDAVVTVVFNPATGVRFEGEKVVETFPAVKRRFKPGTPTLAEVVATGDYEAYLSWAIGLRSERPFRIAELDGPPRLVIDFETDD